MESGWSLAGVHPLGRTALEVTDEIRQGAHDGLRRVAELAKGGVAVAMENAPDALATGLPARAAVVVMINYDRGVLIREEELLAKGASGFLPSKQLEEGIRAKSVLPSLAMSSATKLAEACEIATLRVFRDGLDLLASKA